MALAKKAIAVAGSQLFLSETLPATHSQTGFEAVTWTESGNIIDMGSGIGKQYNTVNFESVNNPETEVVRTNFSSGVVTITFAVPRSGGDDGHDIIKDAVESGNYISVKVLLSNGDIVYGKAMINGAPLQLGTVGNLIQRQATFTFYNENLGFVEVPAP